MSTQAKQSYPLRPVTLAFGCTVSFWALNASAAYCSPACQLDRAQTLFGQTPRPDATITALLDACANAGDQDYRIPLLQGVIARTQGRLDEAAALLEDAHRQAPQEKSPILELALTQEWRGQTHAARTLYAKVLARDPHSRAALLGLARVARAQYHFAEAKGYYDQLLQINPQDVDARNGLAWIALANKQFGPAHSGFSGVLALQPGNVEAQTGLNDLGKVWRYQLDLIGGATHTDVGSAGMGGADLQIATDAFNTFEVGDVFNSSQLPVTQLTQQTTLPTDDVRLGYYYRVPQGGNFSLAYDYRMHAGLPSEHWITASTGSYFGNGFQWVAGARTAFGAPEWNNLLLWAGATTQLSPLWQAEITGYFDSADYANAEHNFFNGGNTYAFVVDLNRQGPGNSFFNVGIGYSPDISNLDLHARFILPVTPRNDLLFAIEHVSINHEYQASLGWRFSWQ